MGVKIENVLPHSPAQRVRIRPGDTLIAINNHLIHDVLDYRFYMTEKKLGIELVRADGTEVKVQVLKGEYEDLGLEFATYLMDQKHHCHNKCIFCFVDQTPPGMRETLYFKDDDERLSFLFGSYITLTNLSLEEVDRIVRMHISPINVSVHTMNPQLRVKMMANPSAGNVLSYLKRLADGGIRLNIQLVLCPGINDGEQLRFSLDELGTLFPALQSIAAVPVGLTRYREGLYPLSPYTQEEARDVISILDEFGNRWQTLYGDRTVYAADEFYLKAGLPLPDYAYYGDFPQLDNGVGLLTLLEHEFLQALEDAPREIAPRTVSIATGEAAWPLMERLAQAACKKIHGLQVHVHRIVNDFFGHTVTVAGLITGKDLIHQLKDKPLGACLLLPQVMLRHEQDKFLDDVTLGELQETLQIGTKLIENDGYCLLDALLGQE